MPESAELPDCVSILVCDDVYRDEQTKKMVIVGTFNTILAVSMPVRHGKMNVLMTLTNGRGKFELCLSVAHAGSGATILEVKGPMELQDPLQMADINVELLGIEFSQDGRYWIDVKANGKLIAQRPIIVQRGGSK